jgi:tetratricopeptide (TPR) repeat protein
VISHFVQTTTSCSQFPFDYQITIHRDMSNHNSKQNVSTSSIGSDAITTASSGVVHPRQYIAQDFLLIWVDESIDKSTEACQNTLAQLRSVVNNVNIFTKLDEAVDFLTEVHEMKALLILGGTLGQHIMSLIHDIPQLDSVYIFHDNKPGHDQWIKEWVKVKGVHTELISICESLQRDVKKFNHDSIAISFVALDEETPIKNLDQLEPSFMYTQIFKEIILEMEHNEQSIKNFILLWRFHYMNNTLKLNDIAEFERDYCPQSAITWYTRESFVYEMLNRALRMLEGDTIINMGFMIRDLHQQIDKLHKKQLSSYQGKSCTVYRGQGLLKTDFEKFLKTKGGLISFNNFLSTSNNRDVSLVFAEGASRNPNMVDILFKITIDPSISSVPFASIQEVSYFQTEEETIFSMHTVFRVDEITKIENNSSLYQVDLKLTADDDQQIFTLTERIRKEIAGETAWKKLSHLLVKLGQFEKAEELCNVLLEQAPDEGEKAFYYNNLGYIKCNQGDYKKAIEYYEKGLEILQKILRPNHPDLATSYNNIGKVYHNMGEYSKALSFYEKALEIDQKTLPPNHPDLATSYNNIGAVYCNMGEYSKALSFYEKALEIDQKTLPSNHPSLATSYNNIGLVYNNMGEYPKALSFYEKALEIYQKTLPPNHPSLATSYNNIGLVYNNMGEYPKALSYYEKTRTIFEKTLPPNHPSLATSYNNIGEVYKNMGEYSKTLSFYEKALEIRQKTLPPNHPSLATSYNSIGAVYYNMGEYSKALSYFERAQNIWRTTLPSNHPFIKTVQENIKYAEKKFNLIFEE